MWDEQKAQRFEELHKRRIPLTEAERGELAALSTELDGVDARFMDSDAKRMLEQMAGHSFAADLPESNAWIGAVSLTCASIAWLGAGLTWVGGLTGLPNSLTHHSACFPIVAVSLMLAIFCGAASALNQHSKAGSFAFLLGVLLSFSIMICVAIVGEP